MSRPTGPLHVGIVDDEPLARARLARLLALEPGVQVVLEAASVDEALEALGEVQPHLLLLDVQMPGRDGFALVEALGALDAAVRPFVVFVTAHAAHAPRAFDVAADDFLVKPVEPQRLALAVARARSARERRDPAAEAEDAWREAMERRLRDLLEPLAPREFLRHFAVTVGRRTLVVPAGEVDWIKADGNYARLHAGRQQYLVRATMNGLEQQLNPADFVRIHRSAIIRLDRLREVVMLAPGEYRAVLRDGTQLDVMRTYRGRLPG